MPLLSLAAAVTALLAVAGCGGAPGRNDGSGDGHSAPATASAAPAKKRPAGTGGLLSGGVWAVRHVTSDGHEENLPPEARPWIALHDDGTATGDYGCTPFRVKAEVKAASLTLGEDLEPLPAPSASPAAPVGGPGPCRPDGPDAEKELTGFEKKVKEVLKGRIALSKESPYGETLVHLKDERGDFLTLAQARGENFFATRWKLGAVTVYDDYGPDFAAGDRLYFDFHENGEVSGRLGCNDFTAGATFSGLHVFFRDPVLTTHRTCGKQVMEEEASVLATLKKSLNYAYWAEGNTSLLLHDDLAFPAIESGFMFSPMPRR
ncbi:META domain-containing protein [Streptomyces sp. NPDC048595]|uniref:META domain-containing protein n=1 Tax=Streptomyces sp. NPDC048595 TaxID=3365576 RepID=UPI003717F635